MKRALVANMQGLGAEGFERWLVRWEKTPALSRK